MDITRDIQAYRERRQHRLDSRKVRLDDETEAKAKGTKLPYALCKSEGIDTTGMTPSEAWEALKGKTGVNPKDAYKGLQDRSKPRKGKLDIVKAKYETKPDGTKTSKVDYGAIESSAAKALSDLPIGAIVDTGDARYTKIQNGLWGESDRPHDPRWYKSEKDLAGKVSTRASLGKDTDYEVHRKKPVNSRVLLNQRRDFFKEDHPNAIVSVKKHGKDYTDFYVQYKDDGHKYTTRVFEGEGGKRLSKTLTQSDIDVDRNMRGGKAS